MGSGTGIKLTKTVTVARYRELEAAGDLKPAGRAACGQFLVQRFQERYFEPTVEYRKRHGFTLMAVSCLVIEALECFYEGEADSKGKSRAMFEAFFKRGTGLEGFGGGNDWFYKQIRCGILHQAETTGGWRVLRTGPLLDAQAHAINAKKFIDLLRAAVADYAKQLEADPVLWANFKKKMDAVCKNCEVPV
jgi:hypothetical protein